MTQMSLEEETVLKAAFTKKPLIYERLYIGTMNEQTEWDLWSVNTIFGESKKNWNQYTNRGLELKFEKWKMTYNVKKVTPFVLCPCGSVKYMFCIIMLVLCNFSLCIGLSRPSARHIKEPAHIVFYGT